jgi:predicted CoA-substrate-specific enzyme activase
VAALEIDKEVCTILEIGGQDSKIILLKNGIVTDFAMNTVCAAGTGSFLDRQAERLEIPIENFGEYALKSKSPVRIAGRCAVFAESDMIHKQQLGYNEEDIIGGLCEAMVRNYLSNVGKGKGIRKKIFFQGGVAANIGIKVAFETALETEVYVPEHYDVMGAIGVAILAKEEFMKSGKTSFKGFEIATNDFVPKSIECNGCGNSCEVIEIKNGEKIVGCFGDRCGKWSNKMVI